VKVLVVSDTHLKPSTLDHMPHEVWALADEADVVLHAGDVVEPVVLHELRKRAGTVHAVLGNNDHGLAADLPVELEVELDGVRVAMLHDSGPTAGRSTRLTRRFAGADVIVFGHSHDPLVERVADGPLLLNPGSPTHRRRQPVHTVAVLDLQGGEVRDARIVEVGPLAGQGLGTTTLG
jgi:uncharacterized protein